MTPDQRAAALRLARTPISQRDLQWHGETAALLRELAAEPVQEPDGPSVIAALEEAWASGFKCGQQTVKEQK